MVKRGALRASDADRDQIIDRLRNASAEGRLALHEFEHRLTAALRARTYAQLDATVADLPGGRSGERRSAQRRLMRSVRAHPALLAVTIPLVLLAVATLVAVAALWCALVLVLILLGQRHHRHQETRPGAAQRRFGAPHGSQGGRAPWL